MRAQRLRLLKPWATSRFSTTSVLQISLAALPFLLSLASRISKALAPCSLASIFTVLLSGEPPRAAMAWCVGLLIAAVAVRERLRAICSWQPSLQSAQDLLDQGGTPFNAPESGE